MTPEQETRARALATEQLTQEERTRIVEIAGWLQSFQFNRTFYLNDGCRPEERSFVAAAEDLMVRFGLGRMLDADIRAALEASLEMRRTIERLESELAEEKRGGHLTRKREETYLESATALGRDISAARVIISYLEKQLEREIVARRGGSVS